MKTKFSGADPSNGPPPPAALPGPAAHPGCTAVGSQPSAASRLSFAGGPGGDTVVNFFAEPLPIFLNVENKSYL